MSWAGILRPGDQFPPAIKSRLAVMTASSGPRLRRYFGSWSHRYRRFATNLSSPRIRVEIFEAGRAPALGIQCIVHWLDRRRVIATGPGSVCSGDGWPRELWTAFTSTLDELPPGTVAEKLNHFAVEADSPDQPEIVTGWRAQLRTEELPALTSASAVGGGWVPIPAELITPEGTSHCIVSWAPFASTYRSLSEAIASPLADRQQVDLVSQATYYVECTLAELHGIRFGPDDGIEDEEFAKRTEVMEVQERLRRFEEDHIASPGYGRLDAYQITAASRGHRK
jgi:hypothetical protein